MSFIQEKQEPTGAYFVLIGLVVFLGIAAFSGMFYMGATTQPLLSAEIKVALQQGAESAVQGNWAEEQITEFLSKNFVFKSEAAYNSAVCHFKVYKKQALARQKK